MGSHKIGRKLRSWPGDVIDSMGSGRDADYKSASQQHCRHIQLDGVSHNDLESTNRGFASIIDVCHTRRFSWSER